MDRLRKSRRQEKEFAKRHGGQTRAGSGSRWHSKGDNKLAKYLVELKRTDSDSYRIDAKVWNKIRKEAIREGLREPMYGIEISGLKLVAVDYKCPYLTSRDRSYKLVGETFEGDRTVNIEKNWWEYQDPMTLQVAIVHLAYPDDQTRKVLRFTLLLMREEDYFKLVPVI